jgi:hypothetical protein
VKSVTLAIAFTLLFATTGNSEPAGPARDVTTATKPDDSLTCSEIADAVNALAADQQASEQAAAKRNSPHRPSMMLGVGGSLLARSARRGNPAPGQDAAAEAAQARTRDLTALYARKGC